MIKIENLETTIEEKIAERDKFQQLYVKEKEQKEAL